MNNTEKVGLLFFMIGLAGVVVNREGLMFWLALIPTSIGYWLFVGKDLKRPITIGKATSPNTRKIPEQN